MNNNIFIAGHNGMVGSTIYKKLLEKGFKNIVTQNKENLDLLNQNKTFEFLKKKKTTFSNYCSS